MIILGIESSCDETALAIFDSKTGMLGHVVNSQHTIHSKYGGIVPELASRDHIKKLVPLLDGLLKNNKINLNQINLIAFTNGPGLLGPLLTGAAFAKSLAWSLNIKSIEIDHLEAHIFSAMISEKNLKPPFVSLLVSGGHTILSLIEKNSNCRVLGKTLDDSAGEVFDKVARHLGLSYPGGPEISKKAEKIQKSSYKFPRPMIKSKDYNFSFSGLKTSVIQTINNIKLNKNSIEDISHDFESSIIDVLITKTVKASNELGVDNIVITGGVSANKKLRNRFQNEAKLKNIFFPDIEFSTDNGAMIAYLGWIKSKSHFSNNLEINPDSISRFF